MEQEEESKDMKRVLITGANSYIGTSFEKYANEHYSKDFSIDTIDMKDGSWRDKDFSNYDVVYHVAGIAHADVGHVDEATKRKYYEVNTKLAIDTCKKAKADGVKHFIFMSSAIIYGDSAPVGKRKRITKNTKPRPSNFYGDSKWKADKGVRKLADDDFTVAVLRPPMIYGKGSKGNYPKLARMAKKLPIFPDIDNERSMLYIENLCEFLCQIIMRQEGGIFWPQNDEYSSTSDLVRMIAEANGHKICVSKVWNAGVKLATLIPGKPRGLANKAFGSLTYDRGMSEYKVDYKNVNLQESIRLAEGNEKNNKRKNIWIIDHYSSEPKYGGISRQYDFARELDKRGYNVVIISSGFSHYTHSYISDKELYVTRPFKHVRYVYVKTSSYKENDGKERAINMVSFMTQVLRYEATITKKYGRPDVVEGASVHPLSWIAAYVVAKKYKVRFIAEVRDLWPEMWLLNGEKSKYDPMVIFFGLIEKWTYKRADKIIYSMIYGDKYICGKLRIPRRKIALIEQPMDCDKYNKNAEGRQSDLPEEIESFINDCFVCVFTGYYMEYEGVHVMLEAAKDFHDRNVPINFLFIGSGKEESSMKEYVKSNNLDNVLIHERINKELIPSILRSCDICLAHCATEGKEESFKYGISKNKVNEYLFSGNPVVYGRSDEQDPVAKYGGGYVIKPFSSNQFVEKVERIYNMNSDERSEFGKCGKEYIVRYHRVDSLVDKLLEVYEV